MVLELDSHHTRPTSRSVLAHDWKVEGLISPTTNHNQKHHMGLDTTHNCWHGPYSLFHKFRTEVCKAAGLGTLSDYYGFGGKAIFQADDPLSLFLNHSDCEGELTAADCGKIADRLKDLLPLMGEWKPEAEKFIAGLRDAAVNHENVIFS